MPMSNGVSLKGIGILSYLSDSRLQELSECGEFVRYAARQVVLEQGIDQDRLYIVIQGALEVLSKTDGQEVHIGEAGEGDCVGEISLFEPTKTSAMVRAKSDVLLWSMCVEGLQTFMAKYPLQGAQLLLGITQLLSRRLRLANDEIAASRILPVHLGVRSSSIADMPEGGLLDEDRKGFEKLTGKKGEYRLPRDIKR